MYYSTIGILAILILLIENYDIFLGKSDAFQRPAWRVYRRFLFAVLIYYITDILWGVLESCKLAQLLFIDTTIYYVAMAEGVFFWAQYTVAYLEDDTLFGRLIVYAGRLISGIITILAAINIFKPVLFTVDSYSVYRALPGRYVMLVCQILLLLMISIYSVTSIIRQKSEKEQKYRTQALFGLIMAVFLLVQLWFPYLPLYSIAYMLGICLLHTFVINDEKEEYKRGLKEAEKINKLKHTISSLLDNMPCMTFTKDAETGAYLACNQAFADYAHKEDPEGVIGLTDSQLFGPGTAKRFVEDDKMALSMEEPYIFFEDVQDAAGDQRQLQTTKLKYTDTSGRLCLLGMCEDVTDMVRIQHENATTKEAYEKARSTGIIYTHIAQTLTKGYTNLYYIDLDTEEYIEYRNDAGDGKLAEVKRGSHFFDDCKAYVESQIYHEDRAAVLKALDRRAILDALSHNDTFMMQFRLLKNDGYIYVNMKVSRMKDDGNHIIIGVTDIDEQTKQQRAAERVKEERIAYARINALTGDFIFVYIVIPETGRYREYHATEGFRSLALPKDGMDFFSTVCRQAQKYVYHEDLDRFLSMFTREGVISEIERNGIFAVTYRLMINEKPVYVQLKAAMTEENEGRRLIVGINDIDAQIRQEYEYERRLVKAQAMANIDALTGIKNRHAYLEEEERLDREIKEHRQMPFAVVIMDVNGLKKINDTAGHQAGDQYLKDACKIICDIFKRSPVFRVGGDEFAVIAKGNDYSCIEELIRKMSDHNEKSSRTGGIVIACGMAKFNDDESVASVFERADQRMYENKNSLKAAEKTPYGQDQSSIPE